MDQILRLSSYKTFLEERNLTTSIPQFNFTGAADILAEFQTNKLDDMTASVILLMSLYGPVFVLALLGNLLLLVTLLSQRKTLRKAKNLYLFNLAMSDLLVTIICMPTTVGTLLYRLWMFGSVLCKLTAFLQGVAVACSIFTLSAMSVDRYFTIRQSVTTSDGMTSRQAMRILLMTWLTSAVLMAPLLYVRQVDKVVLPELPVMTFCIEVWPQEHDRHIFGLFLVGVIFVLPCITLAICYVRVGRTLCSPNQLLRQTSDSSAQRRFLRRRAARMLIALVVVFIVCWLPYNVTSLCIDLDESPQLQPLKVLPFTLCLGHAHSAVNPLMYWLMNRRFRHNVNNLVQSIRQSNSRFCGASTSRSVPRYV